MQKRNEKVTGDKLVFPAVLTGVVCLFCFLGITILFQVQHNNQEKLRMEHISRGLQSETYETLQVEMAKLQVMEGHLIETDGSFDTFGPIAERMMKDEETIRSFLFAPDGIVSGAFPLEGNEKVIDFDMNTEQAGNLEAIEAIETGNLILAGPFELVEDGIGICGRLPVYLENEAGTSEYWGLVAITLNYPKIFANSSIGRINEQGYACRVWRINPDDKQKQVILETEIPLNDKANVVTNEMSIFNTTWYFSLAPLQPWYAQPTFWFCVVASVVASCLVGYGVYSNRKIKRMKEVEDELRIHNLQEKLEQEQNRHMVSQISSHFFYHTLNSLQSLILLKPDMAVKMAADFARYLRFNVNTSVNPEGIVFFKDEIRAVRAYAEINEVQLGERLQVIFDVADVDFRIPALMIETVVENAIIHGIKPKLEGGVVTIRLEEGEKHWQVIVQDNGIGFDVNIQNKEESIGLRNIRKRMENFEDCAMEIESEIGVGTTVNLFFSKKI